MYGPPVVRGKKVEELRKELDRLHHQAKSNAKEGAGGGVSLWPAMDDMRLSHQDVLQLTFMCVTLIMCTFIAFHFYHGQLHIHVSVFF